MSKWLPLLFLIAFFSPLFAADTRHYYNAMSNTAKLKAQGGGSGTAWAVRWKNKKYTMSNAHVCEIAKARGLNWMRAERMMREDDIQIIAIDKVHDICLLSAMPEADGYTLASDWYTAQGIVMYGYPMGNPLTISEGYLIKQGAVYLDAELAQKDCHGNGLELRETDSIFGKQKMCIRTVMAIYMTAPTFPGNSGSPVLDGSGNVVAMAFAAQGTTSYGYAIPVDEIKDFLTRHLGEQNR